MKAVFRHELSSYFTGLSGCVFGAFLLLFAGIYTMAYNIRAAVSNFEYVLSSMSFIFLIIVPILTMRVFAEEKRQKTDQLLYSLPLTMTEVVIGKYLAMLVVFLIPLCIIGIYPAVLSHFGKVNLAAAYGAIVGFFFLGAALLAVGAFISSVTESQGVAAGLCFAALLFFENASGGGTDIVAMIIKKYSISPWPPCSCFSACRQWKRGGGADEKERYRYRKAPVLLAEHPQLPRWRLQRRSGGDSSRNSRRSERPRRQSPLDLYKA